MSEPHATELAQLRDARIYVAGHQGMVGSAIVRRLGLAGCDSLLVRSRSELDLTNQQQVRDFMFAEQPEYVFLAAARVGGIQANSTYPADFIYDNLMIAANVINAAHAADVRRLLFLGSSCIYPKLAPQPMGEDAILTGTLEPTNEPYAIAKIAGIKLCESFNRQYETDFRSVMPTNLYGPNDNFELETSHVVPALIRKFHEGKESNVHTVEIWGSGEPRREFLHVDDLADACLFVTCLPKGDYEAATSPMVSHVNVGTGTDRTITELAKLVREIVGFTGKISFNTNHPDGAPRKLLDIATLTKLGWQATIPFRQGLEETYRWYLENR
jgi:nucleoside-diphosphate-sugar epimerase